jgi:hypothetical protein
LRINHVWYSNRVVVKVRDARRPGQYTRGLMTSCRVVRHGDETAVVKYVMSRSNGEEGVDE